MVFSVFLMAIGLAACSKPSDYTSVIPDEPVIVFKTNVNNLLKKSEIMKDNQITALLKGAINEMPEESRELMRSILADPANSGFDLDKPVFAVMDNIEQARGFLLFAVSDAEKVRRLFRVTDDDDVSFGEEAGYDLLKVENHNMVALDDSKFLIAFSQGSCDVVEYIISTNKGNKGDALRTFISSEDDMSFYVAYKDILRLAEGVNPEAFALVDAKQFENAKVVSSVNFETGKVVADTKFVDAEAVTDMWKGHLCKPSADLQKFVPGASLGFMQMGIRKMGDGFEKNIQEEQRAEFEQYLAKANAELKKKGLNEELSFSCLNSIDGGVIFGVSEADMKSLLPIPQMTFVAECADDKLFRLIAGLLEGESLVTKSEANIYSLMGYTIGFADGKMFVMPNNLFGQCYAGGSLKGLPENLSDNEMAKTVGDKNGMVIDAKAVSGLIKQLGMVVSREERAVFDQLSKISQFTYMVNEDYSMEQVLEFEDAQTNSLKQIKDIAVSLAIGIAARN